MTAQPKSSLEHTAEGRVPSAVTRSHHPKLLTAFVLRAVHCSFSFDCAGLALNHAPAGVALEPNMDRMVSCLF